MPAPPPEAHDPPAPEGPDASAPPRTPDHASAAPLPDEGRHGIAGTLVRRPVTMFMLFLTLLGTGLLAYAKIPIEFLPAGLSLSGANSLSVLLPYPGAGPREVADQLSRPVEDELRTISGLKEVVSTSREGSAWIRVQFNNDVDLDVAYGMVRDRLERIRGSLPEEMDRYTIFRRTGDDLPIIWAGIQYDPDSDDPYGPIEQIIVPRLEGVDGVAQVGLNGMVDEAVRIFVDWAKVVGYGVNLGDIIAKLRQDNFTLPAGQIDDGQRTFALRVDARFADIDDIRDYPIGNGLVLADIAEIVQARAYRDWVWRINGDGAVGLQVSRESDENTIDVCRRVEAMVEELNQDARLEGYTINVFFNQKDEILASIQTVISSAKWGGLFAVIVLFLFLRNLRMTLLAALAIPSSLLAAIMAVYFGGMTLNIISLTGFTLAIGMLVDNAVVVIENIAKKRDEGERRIDAAGNGAAEVGLAVLTATLTSIVVFLPLVFMDAGRNVQVMLAEVGLPISYSLMASLVVALVFMPTFAALLMPRARDEGDDRAPRPTAADGRLSRRYAGALAWVLDHRFAALLLLVMVAGAASSAGEAVKRSTGGGERDGGVSIEVETPPTYPLAEANEVYARFEEWAEANMDAWGVNFYMVNFDRRGGEMRVWPAEGATREQREALPDLLEETMPRLPGVTATVGWDESEAAKLIRIELRGPDFETLAALADGVAERLETLRGADGEPLLENVKTDLDKGLDEVHIGVDRDRASQLGVDPETLRGMVSWGLGGQRLSDLQVGEREIRVQIEYAQSDEESLEFVRNLALPTDTGNVVPLGAVAGLTFDKALGSIVRRNGFTSTGITASPADDDLFLVSRRIQEVLADSPLPEGYSWIEEGGRADLDQDFTELRNTMLFSVMLIYLLMAILLESAVLPLSILVSIPLAILGINVALLVTGSTMNERVVIGMILLAGIVVNNAIVLLDRVQRLRHEGSPRREALLQGGRERLRPILMTALTTIFGLMPMANPSWFGEDRQSGYESMAISVAGGLAFSTFFTLLAVPLFYTFFDDLGRILAGYVPWRTRPREERAEVPPAAATGALPLAPRDGPV